jgi:hypothetical protein
MCLYLSFFIAHVSFEGKTRERDYKLTGVYIFLDGWMMLTSSVEV